MIHVVNSAINPFEENALGDCKIPLYCDHMPVDLLLMQFLDITELDSFSENE